nr:unnamed protein product [Digitaria exilis]
MAADEQPLVEESTVPIASEGDPSRPCVRPALFLRPRTGDGGPLPPPPGEPASGPVRVRGIQAEFRGWACVPRRWREWVEKLRPRHEPLWRELGILGAVLASTCRVRRSKHERALLQLAAFWSGSTGTFVFPWGEATVTLEDVAALTGLPLLGGPVRAPMSDELEKEVAAIEGVRNVMNRSKKKKAGFAAWVKHFVESSLEKEEVLSAGDGGGELLEHGSFLAMWLSIFVLPSPPFDVVRREVFPLAARLARGQRVALAPAALASIYGDLSALKSHISLGMENEPFISSAPMHILQLWVWERFPQLRPELASSPAPGDHDISRIARWHDVVKRFSSKHVHAVFMSPEEFEWRPYGSCSFFALQPETGGSWINSQDLATSELGFDQDIPGIIPCANSDWEKQWDTYNIDAESSVFIVPNHKPGVTVQYARWWKPYSSACGPAIANASKMKEQHAFVSSVKRKKRKMVGIPASNSGKKLRVDTATPGQPNILAGANVYPSNFSASQAAIKRAAAAPGLVLRACPPHLRSRAMPATAAAGMPQPMPDASNDPLDDIPLSERLDGITKKRKKQITECLVKGGDQEKNVGSVKSFITRSARVGSKMDVIPKDVGQSFADAVANTDIVEDDIPLSERLDGIIKMRKKQITECLVKGGDQEKNVGSVQSFITRSASVGSKKDVIPKDVGQAFADAVANTAIIVEVLSGGSVTKKAQGKCVQENREENLNLTNEENNSITEYCDVLLPNVVLGAVSAGSNEAIVSGTGFDMLPLHEAFVISDDDESDKSSCKDREVNAMHVKSHLLGAKASHIRVGNEDIQLVDARNDAQDSQVSKKVSVQGNHANIVEISDDDLVEEASKENMVFDEETTRQDELGILHANLKSPKMEAIQEPNGEEHLVSERNNEQDNLVGKEATVQNSRDYNIGSVPSNITLREEGDVITQTAARQTSDGLLDEPIEEMHGCIVTGEIDNTDKVPMEKVGFLDYNEKGNEDILVSNQDLESPMEDPAGANRKRAGDSERFSSRMLNGNTELINSEVCTKTLYYLSRFDRMRDAWDKDANSTATDQDVYLPRRAIGTMEMIKKASAIRHAEIAELKKKIHNLKEGILVLEAAELREPLR